MFCGSHFDSRNSRSSTKNKYMSIFNNTISTKELLHTKTAMFTGPTWGPPGSCQPQMSPMLAPCILLSGYFNSSEHSFTDTIFKYLYDYYYCCCCYHHHHYYYYYHYYYYHYLIVDNDFEKHAWCGSDCSHYCDVIMRVMVFQITSLAIVYSTVHSSRSKKTSKLRVTGICAWNSPVTGKIPRTNGQWRGKCFHLMTSSCYISVGHGVMV